MAPSSVHQLLPLPVRLSIGRKLFGSLGSNAVRTSRHRIIKGPCQIPELEAMQYVAQHTSIPVPTIHATYNHQGSLYIEMEYIKGRDLAAAWMQAGYLSADQKSSIIKELGMYVGLLRNLAPPAEGVVASAKQHGVLDRRIGPDVIGPLSQDDFHTFLRGGVPLGKCANLFGEEVVVAHGRHHRTFFTHANLIPRNIIVSGGRIAAIVDWAFAGWYPEYWEFTKAHYDCFPRPGWYAALYGVMGRYDAELAAERALWDQLDNPGIPCYSAADQIDAE